ncbi:phospho-2-dehydro-3-deoxyheptonate aldolase [Streptomyces dangxiongensis]|uniref:Phospho-2-dehydro-3-deoxyheptonate aldolase n=1 Tax=Streptomyces dangxiongensis TaxID=1442032 RepID=A0A3G2JF67_9ACTN|nr:3-deoxy-7-phosphoheptulonate synthase [Streptomyces dangxiongensis]AYN38347.1 phospho-2-dehydro-3-deoxyheptonate aldolase [Streptomyces dangxiongensis]
MGKAVTELRKPAQQQPEWDDPSQTRRIREILAGRPPLVEVADVRALRALLAQVARGEAHVVQAGDCAEDPGECGAEYVGRKSAVLDLLAEALRTVTDKPVVRVGRIAGQFAKPRSKPVERVGGVELPVYRGHMVNGPEPDPESRRHDPVRILTAYMAASDAMEHLGWRGPAAYGTRRLTEPRVWTSHEALVLDYELPMVRDLGDGRRWLGSAHWPWIGERTRQLDGAHIDLVADIVNPVAVKIGPTTTAEEITALCERLDPLREPGRLTFIVRMGAEVVTDRLPALVEAVRTAGHPVIWLSDPMHGNTVAAPDGHKTRVLGTLAREIRGFRRAVAAAGGVAGGLHLETTPDDVLECVTDMSVLEGATVRRTSLCDPRLNTEQAVALIPAWSDREVSGTRDHSEVRLHHA